MKLSDMEVGQAAIITGYDSSEKEYRKRLMAMGLTKGTSIKVTKKAPLGDPIEIQALDYKLSLRKVEGEALILEESGNE